MQLLYLLRVPINNRHWTSEYGNLQTPKFWSTSLTLLFVRTFLPHYISFYTAWYCYNNRPVSWGGVPKLINLSVSVTRNLYYIHRPQTEVELIGMQREVRLPKPWAWPLVCPGSWGARTVCQNNNIHHKPKPKGKLLVTVISTCCYASPSASWRISLYIVPNELTE